MIINNIFPFFTYFSKTIDFTSVFGAEMNSACKNTIISTISWVFLHAEFISALKTEPKSMVFEKYAKNGKKKYLLSLFFYFLRFLYKSFN